MRVDPHYSNGNVEFIDHKVLVNHEYRDDGVQYWMNIYKSARELSYMLQYNNYLYIISSEFKLAII